MNIVSISCNFWCQHIYFRWQTGWAYGWSSSTRETKQTNSSKLFRISIQNINHFQSLLLWENPCLIRLILNENPFTHLSHLNFFPSFLGFGSFSWILMCLFQFLSIGNCFLQMSHTNGLISACTVWKWFFK